MRRHIHILEIHEHIAEAQKVLLLEREELLHAIPQGRLTSREAYAFAYVRAERFGTKAIRQRLDGLSWLPLHIDPAPEMLGKKYAPMNRWINSYAAFEPCAVDFGNDLMHALTRSALRDGWNTPPFLHTASRAARLFHDMTCLLNMAYFLSALAHAGIESMAIRLSDDLLQSVTDLAHALRSPDVFATGPGHAPAVRRPDSPGQKSHHLHHHAPRQRHDGKKPSLRLVHSDKNPPPHRPH